MLRNLAVLAALSLFATVAACATDTVEEPTSNEPAEVDSDSAELVARGTKCGANTCAAGTYCCNASCGTCVKYGNSCTAKVCSPTK